MWQIIQWLWVGHIHKWKVIKEYRVTDEKLDVYRTNKQSLTYDRFICQCEKCGAIKIVNAK